ncbi:MAG: PorT family protein [Saprospiraceae bacterium]|nr:PorT family protein [Saprospiraceae bacterium]
MKNNLQLILLFLINCFIINDLDAQSRFRGGFVAGLNMAQLDGDNAAGYHKIGLSTGIRATIELGGRWEISTDILFSQRGSRTTLNESFILRKSTLNYLEVPVLLNLRDWLRTTEAGETYYKVHLSVGLSYGRLFSETVSPNFTHAGVENLFAKNDLSGVFGVGYFFNRNWGATARIAKSLNFLFDPSQHLDDKLARILPSLRGHFITFQSFWLF